MNFILECNCGSHNFQYDDAIKEFRCNDCSWAVSENEAGLHLVEDVQWV